MLLHFSLKLKTISWGITSLVNINLSYSHWQIDSFCFNKMNKIENASIFCNSGLMLNSKLCIKKYLYIDYYSARKFSWNSLCHQTLEIVVYLETCLFNHSSRSRLKMEFITWEEDQPKKFPWALQGQKENWQRSICYRLPCLKTQRS